MMQINNKTGSIPKNYFLRYSIPFLCLLIAFSFTQNAGAQKNLEFIYVINEGAFQQGNASVTRYNADTGTATQNAFFARNGRLLGDVANSASIIGDYLYIVVNNSHTIEVVNTDDLASVATIGIDDTDGGSPRHILQVDENRAFVTNMFGNSVSVIDLLSHSVVHTIPVAGNPEGLAMSESKVFVAQSGLGSGNSIAVIDPVSMEVTSTMEVGDNPQVIRAGRDGSIWVLCTGDYGYDDNFEYNPDLETPGEIHVIKAADETPVHIIEIGGHPEAMQFYEAGNALFVLNRDTNGSEIQRVNTLTYEVEVVMAVAPHTNSFGIINADVPGLIVGVAPNFDSSGRAVMYSLDGVPVDSFATGIGPGDFVMMYAGSPVSVLEMGDAPSAFTLEQNHPNPFNPSTVVPFKLKTESHVSISVYDINGRLVSVITDRKYPAGSHAERFDAADLASGVYVVRMQTSAGVQSGKMMLLR